MLSRHVARVESICRAATCVLVAVIALSGCVTPSQNRQDALLRITRQYNDGLRWGRYQDVTPHLTQSESEKFLTRTAGLADDFEMADQEVTSISFKEGGMRADVLVDFTWYNQRRSLVRRTVVAQDWRFVEGRWICAEQRRVRGDRFPLIAEPAEPTTDTSAPPPPGGPDR